MGFGPNLPDTHQAVRAVLDIVSLLYPERATDEALAVLQAIASVVLQAKAPMSFESIQRFLDTPDWREQLLERAPEERPAWDRYRGQAIAPAALDPNFAWLLTDRLQALGNPPDA